MPRPRHEPADEVLPDAIAALDLLRSVLLAADVAALTAGLEDLDIEQVRLRRRGDAGRPAAAEAREEGRRLEAGLAEAERDLALSRLDVPSPRPNVGVLHGRVVDTSGPVEKATVVAVDDNGREVATTETDERGQYRVEMPALAQGRIRLEVRKGRRVLRTERPRPPVEPGRVGFHDVVVVKRR